MRSLSMRKYGNAARGRTSTQCTCRVVVLALLTKAELVDFSEHIIQA